MGTEHRAATTVGPGRLIAWASLLAGVIGVMLFGSVVAGAGEWVEGRELPTVGPWAIPALVMAVVATLAAARTLIVGKGCRVSAVLSVTVALAVVLMVLVNPSIAPSVP